MHLLKDTGTILAGIMRFIQLAKTVISVNAEISSQFFTGHAFRGPEVVASKISPSVSLSKHLIFKSLKYVQINGRP